MNIYDNNNIFAKILAGDLPCYKTIETDMVLGFMDIFPRSSGHSLVIPKIPARGIIDCPDDYASAIFVAAKKIAIASYKVFDCDGICLKQLNETEAGQVVFHTHVHIIPRYKNISLSTEASTKADDGVLANQAELLRNAL